MFGAIPIIISVLNMAVLVFVYPFDTPPMLYKKGHQEKLEKLMKKIYKPGFADQRIEMVKEEVENRGNDGGEEATLSWNEVFCGVRYSRATFVGIVLAMLQQLTGINVIIFYSNTIFAHGTDLPAETITFLVGAVNFVSTLGGMFLLTKFGRRSITLVCTTLMAVVLCLLGWSA